MSWTSRFSPEIPSWSMLLPSPSYDMLRLSRWRTAPAAHLASCWRDLTSVGNSPHNDYNTNAMITATTNA